MPRFADVLGQNRAKQALQRMLARARIPHAYLFSGLSGVGKTSTALAFAQALNCHALEDGDACGRCPACRQMAGGNYPDLAGVAPEPQAIRIQQIRALEEMLGFAPFAGRYRLCLVQQADKMTVEAANCFLKMLEEPPPGNVFVLCATEPLDLLPTIVSRCQRVAFQPLGEDLLCTYLVGQKAVPQEQAAVLARLADGSLGRALRMLEGRFLERREAWLEELMGLPRLAVGDFARRLLDFAGEARASALDGSGATEPGLVDMLTVWAYWYRDLLLLHLGGEPAAVVNRDFSLHLRQHASALDLDGLLASIRCLEQAQAEMRRNRNIILVMAKTLWELKTLWNRGRIST